MPPRIRHCVQCPKCLTQYLIPCSPYRNGSYLIPTVEGSSEEYALYCSCGRATFATLLTWSEVKTCDVSNAAYDRGYGTPEEIVPVRSQQDALALEISKHLNNVKSLEKRRNPR